MSTSDIISAIQQADRKDLPAIMVALAARLAEPSAEIVSITPADTADLVDVKVAAKLLGVSQSWLHHRPNLPFRRKLGGKVKFSRKGIAEWSKRDHHDAA